MINSIYNYYVTNYNPPSVTREGTHKKSELRSIYNNIVKLNKYLPLYKITVSDAVQNYAFNVKESALALNELANSFSFDEESPLFSKKIAVTDDDSSVFAKIVDEANYDDLPEDFNVKVNTLATSQVNTGRDVISKLSGIREGSYAFTIDVNSNVYEFQFNVPEHSSSMDVQKKLANFINRSNIGIEASVETGNSEEMSKIVLKSDQTGTYDGTLTFALSDVKIGGHSNKGIVNYYGLNNVSTYPANSSFNINGVEMESMSNTFVYDNCLEISLLNPSMDDVHIDYEMDVNDAIDHLAEFTESYNNIINVAVNNSEDQKSSHKLYNDFYNISSVYSNELESAGMNVGSDGKISIDKSLACQSIKDGTLKELFNNDAGFIKSLTNRAKLVTLNPMEYVDKTIVTYPDPSPNSKRLPNPYVTSMYSGMLFNYYC